MSELVKFRKAVEDTLKAKLPTGPDGIRFIGTHIGEFGKEAVVRYATSAPSVVLAPLNMEILRRGATVPVQFLYGAFVLTKTISDDSRGDVALAIIEALAKLIPFQTWGHEHAQAPTDIDAGNLYTGEVDELGISLWAVRWKQIVTLTTLDTSDLGEFLLLHAEYNLDPGDDDPDDFDAPQDIELEGSQ